MFNRRLLIQGIGGDSGLFVKIKVINDTSGSPIPLAKVYVEGGTSTIQTTDAAGNVEWRGFKKEDVKKSFVVRVADTGMETYLNYTNSFQLRGLANETWIVPLSNSNNSAKCYLLSEKTLAPVNDAAISVVDQSTTPVGIPDMFTVDGLAEWQGLTLDVGEYCFYYKNLPVSAISEPFAANLSTVQIIRYMLINPPLEGITIGEYPSIAGILGYSDGSSDAAPETFGNINPKRIQMTPSTKGTIKFVMLQQDQCNIEIDVGENDPIYENAILTLKMSNLPEMNFGFIMWGYSEKDNTTCAFGNNDPNLTTQWWSYWGANIGNTLPFELTSSINVAGLFVGNSGGYYGYSDGSVLGTGTEAYGKLLPNPITISGKTGEVKCLYITGRTYITMYILWDGSGFPTDLRVVFGSYGDIIMPYVDFFDDMAVYEFGGDPDVTEQLYEVFLNNVGNIIPCTISNPNIDLPTEPPIEI
jgi:hypothetical protein